MRTQFLTCAIFAVASIVGILPVSAFASVKSEQLAQWNERFDERIAKANREEARIEEERLRIDARLKDMMARNDERAMRRVERVREVLCSGLERMRLLHTVTHSVPGYCVPGEPDPDPTPVAPTLTLSAAPPLLTEGEEVTLSWDSADATACSASDGWTGEKAPDGMETLVPSVGSHTYSLTCVGSGGSITRAVDVTVSPRPVDPVLPNVVLASDEADGEVTEGDSVVLSWNSVDALSCVADGASDWTGSVATSGSQAVTVYATTVYTLTCGNAHGSTSAHVEVRTVRPVVVPTVALTPSETSVEQGAGVRLEWSSTDATVCIASGADDFAGDVATTGAKVVSVAATTTYRMECGNGLATSSAETIVAVTPAPVPQTGGVILSEVYYDVDTATRGADPLNEWVELFNTSPAAIDISGWKIGDGVATDTLPAVAPLAPGARALIVATSATAALWSDVLPAGTVLVSLGSSIGNGLGNTGDAVHLLDASGVETDAMSYGTNASAFPAGTLAPADGKSFARTSGADTPFAPADWVRLELPTPGLL